MEKSEQIKQLERLLEGELEVHGLLVQAAGEMNRALRQRDPAGVKTASFRYDELTCRIEQLEEERLALCDLLGSSLGSPQRHLCLAAIVDSLGADSGKELSRVRHELRQKLNELIRINTSNKILIEESLETFAHVMDLMARSSVKSAGYQRQGAPYGRPEPRAIINRTV